jgi:hypothetical protein
MGAMMLGYLQTQNSAGECGMPHFVSYDRVIPSNQLPLENVLNDQTLTGHKKYSSTSTSTNNKGE